MKRAVIESPHVAERKKQHSGTLDRQDKADLFLYRIGKHNVSESDHIKGFCDTYAVTHQTFTRLTGFSPRAVANWVKGQIPSSSTKRRLNELKRLFTAMENLVSEEAIGPWLKEPNPAFDGSTPIQVIERGEIDRIWRMIYELESGEPG
jgi:DNA-binding transcriptional regulator YiaG